ncbi:MAG: D-2-hydroxyacid dehydrogenase [Lachnospiraceae bacterium]|nr:D-2-hydroxyacid dehydrogenase [Lachnospiraceae bacterium]
MKIVVTLPVNESHKQAFQAAAPDAEILYMPAEEVTEELLQTVTVTIGNISPSKLKGYHNIQWVQLSSAGTDGYTTPGVLAPGTALTNSTGAYGLNISEHMIAQLLMMIKHLEKYYEAQKEKRWSDYGTVRSIYGSTTLVVGLGDIGGEFARKMHLLGSRVIGIRRNVGDKPEYLDALYSLEQLDELLPQADYVACSLPGTNATYHLFDAQRLDRMKEGAILINVGRGSAVDSYALNEALRSGHLGGACLDVVEPEPLPEDHPLWNAPNLLLTPHVSGFYHLPETLERVVRIAVTNLKAFVAGEPLKNHVDFTTGYRKNTEDNKAI